MPITPLIIVVVLAGAYVAWVAVITGALTSNARSPLDVEQKRREMLASARSPEELAYLKELDRLELHRRHLVC